MKKLTSIFLILIFFSCQSYYETVDDSKTYLPNSEVVKFLQKYEATDDSYSVLIFTNFYNNDKIKIFNGKNAIEDSIQTIKNYGFAKAYRISNDTNTTIVDLKSKTKLRIESSKAKNYKFIYIIKQDSLYNSAGENGVINPRPFTITYRKNLRGFM